MTKKHTCGENCQHDKHNHHENDPAQAAWMKQVLPDEIIPLTIPWKKLQTPYEKVLSSTASKIQLDGFRHGKVPAHLAKEQVDQQYLVRQVLPQVVGEFFAAALEKTKLAVVGEPEFAVTKSEEGQDWQIEVHLAVRPEIKFSDYKKELQKAKTEAEKKITSEDLESVKKLNENAKKAGKEESAKPLDKNRVQQMAIDQALNVMHAKYAPGVNRLLVMRQAGQELEKLLDQLKQFNLELETYLKNSGLTHETLNEQILQSALRNLQMEFLLEAIIEAEKITADPKRVEEKLADLSPDADAEKKAELLKDARTKTYLEMMVKRQALADWLMSL